MVSGEDNDNRRRIKLLISLVPGLHLRAVQRLLSLSFASTRYHVDVLQKSGEIVRTDDGGYSRLYPSGVTEGDRAVFSVLNKSTDRLIISSIVRNVRVSHRDLVSQTGSAKSTISEHLSNLVRMGIVIVHLTDENHVEYELADPERVKTLIGAQNPRVLRKATDRFIDLWDF